MKTQYYCFEKGYTKLKSSSKKLSWRWWKWWIFETFLSSLGRKGLHSVQKNQQQRRADTFVFCSDCSCQNFTIMLHIIHRFPKLIFLKTLLLSPQVERCSEVLIVDATYKSNMYKFPLLNAIGISNTYGDHYNKNTVNNRSLMNF